MDVHGAGRPLVILLALGSGTRADGPRATDARPPLHANVQRVPQPPYTVALMGRRLRSATFPNLRHSLPQAVADAGLIALAYWLGYLFRLDSLSGPKYGKYGTLFDRTLPWLVGGSVLLLALGGVYQRRWRYTTQRDLERLLRLLVLDTVLLVAGVALVQPYGTVYPPHGTVLLYFLLSLGFLAGIRLFARSVHDGRLRGFRARRDARTVLIVGAGDGGRLVLRELLRNAQLGLSPVGFVDDDPRKQRLRIDGGVRVRGTTTRAAARPDELEPDEVIIAIPSAPGVLRMRVVTECRERGIPVRTLPTVFELLRGGIDLTRQVREVQVEDVLGREPVLMELERVGAYLAGKVVLVTGAGGSIGSELCRQITRVSPRRIVLVDHAEDNIFAIQRELLEDRHVHPDLLVPVLADVKEEERLREVFAEQRPQFVFHAAAYKHVGLLESNPVEAIHNNAIGTRVVASVAGDLGAEAFVLISTDKAVSPQTVMGASKALAECAVEIGPAPLPRDAVHGSSLRQRARLLRQRRADLSPADRRRRPGDRDRRADDTLLHDDPGGRATGDPLGFARRGRRAVRARHGGARLDHDARAPDDRALWPRARDRHCD